MPCDRVTSITTDTAQWDETRARAAIMGAGVNAYYERTAQGGRLTLRGVRDEAHAAELTARIAKQYTRLTVEAGARRFGWRTAAATLSTGQTQITLQR